MNPLHAILAIIAFFLWAAHQRVTAMVGHTPISCTVLQLIAVTVFVTAGGAILTALVLWLRARRLATT